jgi:hypothetical protein
VRTFRVRLYADDLSFLQAGHPALFTSDSSFSVFYPDYHKPSDTADKLDATALERVGQAVLGTVRALERTPRGAASEPHWFVAFGRVYSWSSLVALGALSLLPGFARALRAGGPAVGVRAVQALLRGRALVARAGAGALHPAGSAAAAAFRTQPVDGAFVARAHDRPSRAGRLGVAARGRERRLARALGDRRAVPRARARVSRARGTCGRASLAKGEGSAALATGRR